MKGYLIIFLLFSYSFEILAQKDKKTVFIDDTRNYLPKYGQHIVAKENYIYKFDITSQLSMGHVSTTICWLTPRLQIKGFRIQIYQGKERTEATETRHKCFTYFEEYHPYLQFKRPTYDVCLGDFYTKKSAKQMFKSVKKHFPKAKIVEDMVWKTNIENLKSKK